MTGRALDLSIADISEAYAGPIGALWELLMGEEIHVGGAGETDRLAALAGVKAGDHLLDICSALGGPARHLAAGYGCRVIGVDATAAMVREAERRTEKAGLVDRVSFRLGNALDLPFRGSTFDIVWGQDAWCYVTDRERLISEAGRVAKPGGILAFTDWVETGRMTDGEREALLSFMLFPTLETPGRYDALLARHGWEVTGYENLDQEFALALGRYRELVTGDLRAMIIEQIGQEMYTVALQGIAGWEQAAHEGKVGRGRWIARKAGP
ncbi:class I SAM-dependent methyltransferase [Methanosphaerula subterraneus]|uniref:class I SAM-dependent methyltransferase n=1 Tax=Methanosphaerula subterraneus TaxID=3350244 RepID=UPI003F879E86